MYNILDTIYLFVFICGLMKKNMFLVYLYVIIYINKKFIYWYNFLYYNKMKKLNINFIDDYTQLLKHIENLVEDEIIVIDEEEEVQGIFLKSKNCYN